MRREAHEAASESCEKTGWGAPECPEKLSQVKSNTRKNEKSFSTVGRRPGRPSPTVPPRPLPWLPTAMADLRHASRVVWHRARAQGSQPPSPVGVVGWRKHLALLFVRPQLFLAMPTLL